MGLYRRGKTYWFTITHNGKRMQASTGTANKKLAERIHAKALSDVYEGKWFQNEARRRTFEELKERYMAEYAIPNKAPGTVEKDRYSFKRLSEVFSGCSLAEITPQRIADYKRHRREAGASTSTLARELEVLRASLNLALREWEWIETSPFWKVKIDQPKGHRERWITREEEEALLDASPVWLRDIIIFALNTGMRQGEILSLRWPQADLKRGTVTLLVTKNRTKRTIPLNQAALGVLGAYSKVRHISGYVFTSSTGTKIDRSNLRREYVLARKKAGLEDVTFHDLRHTFATRISQAGVELLVISKLLGHKDLRMTLRYAHHNTESLRHGVDILDVSGAGSATICYNSATVGGSGKNEGVAQDGQLPESKEFSW